MPNHPPLLWIVTILWLRFTEIQPKSTDFALNQKGWFLMIYQKIIKNSSQIQNLGQLGLRNCVCVCVCFFSFFFCMYFRFLFCFLFCFFFVFVFFFYSWPDLMLHLFHHNARFQFQKYNIFSFSEDTFPSDTPVCMQACNWPWRSTNSFPNVEDGCPSLCSFGVIAVVKCMVDKL